MIRGLVKEMIGLLTWLAAFVVACLFSGPASKGITTSPIMVNIIQRASESIGINSERPVAMLAIGVSFIGLFIITLVIGNFINRLISSGFERQGISLANRVLGALFGLGRGFLTNLIFLFLMQLTPIEAQAAWKESIMVAYYRPALMWLGNMISPDVEGIKSKAEQTVQKVEGVF